MSGEIEINNISASYCDIMASSNLRGFAGFTLLCKINSDGSAFIFLSVFQVIETFHFRSI